MLWQVSAAQLQLELWLLPFHLWKYLADGP